MSVAVFDFVVLDDDQSCDGGEDSDVVERGVCECSLLLLFTCVGRLEDEDALDEEQDGGGVEELGSPWSDERGAARARKDLQDVRRTISNHARTRCPI